MADTSVQLEVEDYVRTHWMPGRFDKEFSRDSVKLSCGGTSRFNAVSADRKIVASISTSGAKTARGKLAVGKILKIRSDLYFLLLVETERRVVVFTEADMYEQWQNEQASRKVPNSIEFFHVQLPDELNERLIQARRKASEEVSPS